MKDRRTRHDSQGFSPLAFVGAGFEMAATVVVLGLAGYWLDRWLGTKPWLLVAGVLGGVAVAMIGFYRRVVAGISRRETDGS